MPTLPPRPCTSPGCAQLVHVGRFCDEHKRAQEAARPSARRRGYDAAWERLRLRKLAASPLCECDECQRLGRVLPANVVNHRIEIAEQPALRLDWDNLQSMAKACHDAHTAATRGWGRVNSARGGE